MNRIVLCSTLVHLTLTFSAVSYNLCGPHGRMASSLTQRPPLTPQSSRLFLAAVDGDALENGEGEDQLQPLPRQKSLATKLMGYCRGPNDGLTFRQRLAKYGLAAVLSYGAVSNVGGCIAVSISWYIFCKRNMVSPLAPGQLKPFLAVYAGFFVFLNIIRPIRFAFSIAISPFFDRIINGLQRRFSFSRTSAIVATVFLVNVLGSVAVLVAGVSLASLASGVPIFPLAKP